MISRIFNTKGMTILHLKVSLSSHVKAHSNAESMRLNIPLIHAPLSYSSLYGRQISYMALYLNQGSFLEESIPSLLDISSFDFDDVGEEVEPCVDVVGAEGLVVLSFV